MKYVTTGIDIGTESIRICLLENDTKEQTHNVIGFFKYPIEGLRKGHIGNEILFRKGLKKALAEIAAHVNFKIESAAVSTPSGSIESVILSQNGIVSKSDHEITEFDIDNIEKQLAETAEQKTRKILWSNIIEYKVDNKVMQSIPYGLKGVKIEVKKLFVHILSQQSDLIDTLLYENEVELAALLPKGIIAARRGLSDKEKNIGCGYVDIGAETTSLVVYENDTIIGYTLMPIGSNDITNDIALGLKISLEEAEQVKYGNGSAAHPRRKIEEIIGSRLEDICELATVYLKKIKRHELLPAGLILNGGGVDVGGIEDKLKKSLNLPVKKINFEILTQKKGVIRHSEYLECYSLALHQYELDQTSGNTRSGSLLEKIKKSSSSFLKQFLP